MELNGGDDFKDIIGYDRLLEATGFKYKQMAFQIQRGQWGHGATCTIFAWDNTANKKADCSRLNPRQPGNVRLEIQLNAGVAPVINVVVYGEFENILKIDPNNTVLYDPYGV